MTDFNASDRDVTRAIRSWLHEDRHEDVSRIAAAVLDRVEATPRRRASWWPARRFPDMNNFAKVLVAAAAVVAVAFVGINLLPRSAEADQAGRCPRLRRPLPHPRVRNRRSPGSRVGFDPAGTYLVSLHGKSVRSASRSQRAGMLPADDTGRSTRSGAQSSRPAERTSCSRSSRRCLRVPGRVRRASDRPPRTGPTRGRSGRRPPCSAELGRRPSRADITHRRTPGTATLTVSVPKRLDVPLATEGDPPDLVRCRSAKTTSHSAHPSDNGACVHGRDVVRPRLSSSTGFGDTATAADKAELQSIVDSIQIEPRRDPVRTPSTGDGPAPRLCPECRRPSIQPRTPR